jgi:prepilin-type N-terminal cleavage/methylation domain-containing protein
VKSNRRTDSTPPSRPAAFTLLELLVALAVLALLITVLMGLVDSAAKLWRESEARVDAYREARAALNVMQRDLRNAVATTNQNFFRLNTDAYAQLADAEKNTNYASAVFFLSAQPANAQASGQNRSDVCQVGYFLAYGKTSMSPAAQTEQTMNLYRYFLSSDPTFQAFTNTNSPPFNANLTPTDLNVELLARNIKSIRLTARDTNGLPYVAGTNSALPPLVEIEMIALNQDAAGKLRTKSDWTNSTGNLQRITEQAQQTFQTRVRVPNAQ